MEGITVQPKQQRKRRCDAMGRKAFLVRLDPAVLARLKLRAQIERSSVNQIVNVELRDATAHLTSNGEGATLPL